MFEKESLRIFSRQPITDDMIQFLVSTTKSIIEVKRSEPEYKKLNDTGLLYTHKSKTQISLNSFIRKLIEYSNVQTPTLMATLVYLNRLRSVLPANAIGIETTRHRIFLASLILSAKSLNDSSPLNKHWCEYTDGLLSLQDINMAERELISLLRWNLVVNEEELDLALQPFLNPIKVSLKGRYDDECSKKAACYKVCNGYPTSKSRSTSSSSISSYRSNLSLQSSHSLSSLSSAGSSSYSLDKLGSINEVPPRSSKRVPLSNANSSYLNRVEHSLKPSGINLRNEGRIIA